MSIEVKSIINLIKHLERMLEDEKEQNRKLKVIIQKYEKAFKEIEEGKGE